VARTFSLVVIACALVAGSPAAGAAEGELSLRLPVGVAFTNQAHFVIGGHAELLVRPNEDDLAFGLAGELDSVAWSYRRAQLGLALQHTPGDSDDLRHGPGLEAGYSTDSRADALFIRGNYQVRTALMNSPFRYVFSTAVFAEIRRTVTGPSRFEASVGLEVGGAYIAAVLASIASFIHDG
jgi:hypothetical protein